MEGRGNRKLALLRVLGSLLLGLAVVVGLLYFLVAVNLSQNLVESETYSIAVSDTNAYNRIYQEVLADPEVKENIGNLLGGVEFDEVDEGTEVLREVMPPSYLQAQTEDNINRFTGFLRGEREELEIYARLRLPLERVESAVLDKVHRRIEELEIREPPSPGCSVPCVAFARVGGSVGRALEPTFRRSNPPKRSVAENTDPRVPGAGI